MRGFLMFSALVSLLACSSEPASGGSSLEAELSGIAHASFNYEALEPVVRGYQCFHVDPELEVLVPTTRDTATKVAARWGWDVTFDEPADCASRLQLGEVVNAVGGHAGASHCVARDDARSGCRQPDATGLSGAYAGGASVITFNRQWIEELTIVDTVPAGCEAARPVVHYLFAALLTHELGHMLGLDDVGDPESIMYGSVQQCFDAMPTAEEIAASLRPPTPPNATETQD